LRGYSALRERNESHTNRRYGAIRPVAAIALVFAAGLMLAIGAEAKPKHQPLKCKAGYTRRTVWIPQRAHGRFVLRHGRIVRVKVQRCVKTPQTKSASPKSPPGGNPTTPTTPTTYRPPVTTTPAPTTTTTTSTSPTPPPPPPPPPSTGDPVVVAVGDIAQPHGCAAPCPQSETAALAQSFSPTAVLVLGDNQYDNGTYSEYTGSYDLSWGHAFNPIVHPVLGNHEYGTSGAAGYFQYFGANGVTTGTPGGYYSFNVGSWHIDALNSNCSDSGCTDAIAGGATSAEISWLKSDLAANRSACVLATWHHPLFSDGWTLGTAGVGGGIAQLWSTLYSAHADAVLNGHDHLYERYAQEDPSGTATTSGIREFVVGTGGESLNGLSANPSSLQASDSSHYGVLVMTLHASSYDWKFVTTSGATVDSGTAACHGPGATIASVGSRRRFAPAAPVDVARLTGPPLLFDALPMRRSLASVKRAGLPVAVLASRAVDVRVTAWLRHGHRLTPIASFYETESQIPKPHTLISLRLPADRLKGMRIGTVVLRFAAEDGAGHRHTVTRTVRLR
jgi:Calcineurin-like phosphoesterase